MGNYLHIVNMRGKTVRENLESGRYSRGHNLGERILQLVNGRKIRNNSSSSHGIKQNRVTGYKKRGSFKVVSEECH